MPRTKAGPQRQAVEEAAPEEEETLSVRVRHSGGTATVTSAGTLATLVAAIEAQLGGTVWTLSFRDEAMRTVTVLSDGEYPAAGALAVGPELAASALFSNGETLNVSLLADKERAAAAQKSKKRAATTTTTQTSGARTTVEALARDFASAGAGPESLVDTASHFATSRDGALRAEAASKQLVRLVKRSAKTLSVAYRRTPKGKESVDDVRLLSVDECVDLVAAILNRQTGSKRRRASCQNPSTRLLTVDLVATRCPALFWSLYLHSCVAAPDDDDDDHLAGDVAYMLQHCTDAGVAKFRALNDDGGPAEEEGPSSES